MTQPALSPCFVPLPRRGIVRVAGPKRRDFLQRLVSNDVALLDRQPCVYACLLTPQGKFLHDFFMSEEGETIRLDCEGGARAEDLSKRLSAYRLREDVAISCAPEAEIFAISGKDLPREPDFFPDPRRPEMGLRSFRIPQGLARGTFEDWDRRRLSLSLAEGSRDLVPEKSTLAEGRIDEAHGVSYEKGCYVGQELTARMHYRGLGKKRLYPVRIEGPAPEPGTEIHLNGESVGEMRSSCRDLGLALLRDDAVDALRRSGGPLIPLEGF